jgi:hypothetical protein
MAEPHIREGAAIAFDHAHAIETFLIDDVAPIATADAVIIIGAVALFQPIRLVVPEAAICKSECIVAMIAPTVLVRVVAPGGLRILA